MTAAKKTPAEQKAALVKQLQDVEKKIANFDKQRGTKLASLATKYRLVDLSDAVLEKEFKLIRDKYTPQSDPTLAARDATAKKS